MPTPLSSLPDAQQIGWSDSLFSRIAANVIGLVTGDWFQNTAGRSRTTAQFDSTNQTPATVTGLTVNVIAGRTYSFTAYVPFTAAAAGIKLVVNGTATATAIVYSCTIFDSASEIILAANATALNTVFSGNTAGDYAMIYGTITVNAAGTLNILASRLNAAGTCSVLRGATFNFEDMP